MNLYALLPLTAVFANLVLGFYLLYRAPKEKLNRLYSYVTFALAIWALGNYLTFTAPTPEAAFSNRIGTFGSCLLPVFLLHFFLVFSKRKTLSSNKYVIPLYIPPFIFMFLGVATNLMTESAELVWWGYTTIAGPLYLPNAFFIVSYVVASLFVCHRFYSKTKSKIEKSQAKFLFLAVAIPLVGGVLTEVVPIIFGSRFIPLTAPLTTITAILIGYNMLKYALMPVTPGMASKDIIETMADYLVVVDRGMKIDFVNRSTLDAFGYKRGELAQKSLTVIFPSRRILGHIFRELKNKGYLINYGTEILTKNKKRIPVSLNASIVKDRLNKLMGFVFVIRNIKETKELIKSLEEKTRDLNISKRDLQKKVGELESFTRLAVGREIKMIELKRRMRKMEAKTKKS